MYLWARGACLASGPRPHVHAKNLVRIEITPLPSAPRGGHHLTVVRAARKGYIGWGRESLFSEEREYVEDHH